MYSIVIDDTKCNRCGECVSICPSEIYKSDEGRITVGNTADCSNCQSCVSVCEPQAITVTEV